MSQLNTGETYTTVSENTLKEMNKKFKAEMKRLKENQERKLTKLEHKLHLEIEQLAGLFIRMNL